MYVCVYVCDATPPKPLDRFQPNLGQLCISSRREILGGFRVDATSGSQDGGQNDVWKTFLTYVMAEREQLSRRNLVFICFSIWRKLPWGFRVDATSGSQDGGQNDVWKTILMHITDENAHLSRRNLVFICFSIRRKLLWGFPVDPTSGSLDGGKMMSGRCFLTYVTAELKHLSGRNLLYVSRSREN